ncbi:MAG: nitroreductase family protein [Selenomonadaceae bacterium]|nr:nitroreductase family protein [Selenomonadaceae bacterium]
MDFLELVKARYSCRKLTDAAIEPEKIERIIQSAIAAPTAKNLQRYKIWQIQSPEAFDKLKQTTNFTFGSALAFVIGAQKDGAFDRPFDNKNFAEIDAAIVATHMMLAIQAEGLGTTWVGYFDAPKMQQLFPEMKDYELIAVFPVGYPAEGAKPASRHAERRAAAEAVTKL